MKLRHLFNGLHPLRLVLPVIVGLLVIGCGKTPDKMSEGDFLELIKTYNDRLVQAYDKGNADIMKEVTSEKDVDTVRKLIEGLYGHRVKMVAKVKSVKITGKEIPGEGTAVIFTDEIWDYRYVDLKDGSVQDAKTDVPYHMAYVIFSKDKRARINKAMYKEEYESNKRNAVLK